MKISVAIAEDNYFLTKSVVEKLSFFDDLVCKIKAVNGKDIINKLEEYHNIDVILMDIEMPEMDGITATEIIKSKYPHIKVLMLTVFDEDENIFRAIKAGADGYLLKEIDPKSLHSSIVEVIDGGAPMTASIALKTLNLLRNPIDVVEETDEKMEELTPRETEILLHLSKGLNYKLIADNLFISAATVRKHIENIYRKLQVHNKLEAIQKAKKNRIIF